MTTTPFEKFSSSAPAVGGLFLVITLLALLACNGDPGETDLQSSSSAPPPAAEGLATERWHCRNDLEIRCATGACEVRSESGFTPMDVHVDDSGAMSVCAYSGCWEGTGEVLRGKKFLVLVGHDLEFSTSPQAESSRADIVIAIDRADRVATLKAGDFAHPLLCT